jgi:hypothetical protein
LGRSVKNKIKDTFCCRNIAGPLLRKKRTSIKSGGNGRGTKDQKQIMAAAGGTVGIESLGAGATVAL